MRDGYGCLIGGIFDLAVILLVIGSFYIHFVLGLILLILAIYITDWPMSLFSIFDDESDSQHDSVTQKQSDATPVTQDIQYDHLLGRQARASTNLRPQSFVVIDKQKIEAESSLGFIARDSRVKIIGVKDNKLVVESIEEA